MKIIDISMAITPEIMVYNNNPEKRPKIWLTATHEKNGIQETRISMDAHTGTHMDAPLHMIDGGDTIEHTPLEKLIVPCRVLDFSHIKEKISAEDLKQKEIHSGEFILLKTRSSFSDDFDFNFVFVDESGATYLKDKAIMGVGIDAPGIERSQPGHETHRTLLGHEIPIIEGLRLAHVDEGEYVLIALPIKLNTAEAAPMRAILLPAGSLTE